MAQKRMSNRIDKSSLRQKILCCLGEFPPPVDPEPQTLELIPLEDHTREVVSYFVEPGRRSARLHDDKRPRRPHISRGWS